MKTKKTKIIATLGPASESKEILTGMIENGLNLVRLNASHNSDPEYIKEKVELIRNISESLGKSIGIFIDLQGPKIRIGTFKEDTVELEAGNTFILTQRDVEGDHKCVHFSSKDIFDDIQIGEPIYLNDGAIHLKATEKTATDMICDIEQGGTLSNHKGVNLPETNLTFSPFTDKDKKDAITAIENNVDFVALSFVTTGAVVHSFRKFLDDNGGKDIHIISKIELGIAVKNIEDIIDASNAIMVARGDLGVEIGLEKVPETQKYIIHESNRRAKPVIVATQMLETMIEKRTATRAEVSDVANAIYDHCDAVMLSGETAVGIDPENVIKIMGNICRATDEHMAKIKEEDSSRHNLAQPVRPSISSSFSVAADQIATESNAKALLVFTISGKTPIHSSKLNPLIPIIAVTDTKTTYYRMSLYRAVHPIMLAQPFSKFSRWTEMINDATQIAKDTGQLDVGDKIVITAGIPIINNTGTNSIRYFEIK